jgi:hypothetical protein
MTHKKTLRTLVFGVAACAVIVTVIASSASAEPDRAIYELQERCARHALDWFVLQTGKTGEVNGNTVRSRDLSMEISFVNHYNPKLNTCFVQTVTLFFRDKLESLAIYNLLNNVQFGSLMLNLETGRGTGAVSGATCRSQREWDELTRAYLEQ